MVLPLHAPAAAAAHTRVSGSIRSVQQVGRNERCSSQSPASTSGRASSADGAGIPSGRRAALLSGTALISGVLSGFCPPSYAEEPDVPLKEHISKTLRAPANFLRQRLRADGGSKILAPIRASKRRLLRWADLQDAEKLLRAVNIYDPNPQTYKKILQTVRAASMNCYTFDAVDGDSLDTRASLLQKQIGFGDACTYRLIAKNVTLLLTQSQQQLKIDTLKSLDELVNSYQLLDDMVDRARDGDPMAVERVPDVLQFTLAHVNTFEGLIERCLDLPVSNVAPTAI